MNEPGDYLENGMERARATAHAVVTHEFAMFLNPVYRGTKWEWSKFEAHAVKSAELASQRAFTDEEWVAWNTEIKQTVTMTAKFAAKQLLRDSGILSWWSNEIDTLQRTAK